MVEELRRSTQHFLKRTARPAVAWFVTFSYLVVASGLPVPMATSNEKDRSQPFPCMESQCGCQNAEQCWRSCCCHTVGERLAWASANGVTPPGYLVCEIKEIGAEELSEPHDHNQCASCNTSRRGCCHETREDTNQETTEASSVVLVQALACQGAGLHWLNGAIATPPVEPAAPVALIWIDRLCALYAADGSQLVTSPPVPPPRATVA